MKQKLPHEMEKFRDNPEAMQLYHTIKDTTRSVFLAGSAGYGKTTLLHALIKSIPKKQMVVLAPTGVAAQNAGGVTIHNFFGFSVKPFNVDDTAYPLSKEHVANFIEVMIIDEISMVRADLMHKIDMTLRATRGIGKPFGGVQVIMIGDLGQLPPVVTNKEEDQIAMIGYPSRYFLSAPVFQQGTLDFNEYSFKWEYIELKKNYRQSTDQTFLAILKNARIGQCTEADIKKLNFQLANRKQGDVTLCCYVNTAKRINTTELERIQDKLWKFKATTIGIYPSTMWIAPDVIEFKVGAKIMFLKNDVDFVNGTIGVIEKFDGHCANVKLSNGRNIDVTPMAFKNMQYIKDGDGSVKLKEIGSHIQYPFQLAWAITVHKSQGLTFPQVHIDFGHWKLFNGSWAIESETFETGQGYVGLSRCQTLNGVTFQHPVKQEDFKCDEKVLNYLIEMSKDAETVEM